MKYMGSKRAMLANGLGRILLREADGARWFGDLFAGSGAVAWFVGQRSTVRVLASDLQQFAVTLSGAVITRTRALDPLTIWRQWQRRAVSRLSDLAFARVASEFQQLDWSHNARGIARDARAVCAAQRELVITRSYGGHYFSPAQALVLDVLRATLPGHREEKQVALAALIIATSECAASPGHTAQPFQPTKRGARFLFEAWRRNVGQRVYRALEGLSKQHARRCGAAVVSDAALTAQSLDRRDIAFLDPPYSAVQYSRFYHVLEAIARGTVTEVSGSGRYPPRTERPPSQFSVRDGSTEALDELLEILAANSVTTVVTFPKAEASNGLSGDLVETIAAQYFAVSRQEVNGRFSTLGGNRKHRLASIPASEVILTLRPKARRRITGAK